MYFFAFHYVADLQRFLCDAAKCFQHLTGAARILQRFTNPAQLCSTLVGRSIFGWYCSVEDFCCLLSATRPLLPQEWRQENVRIRQKLAHQDYPRLSENERKPRLLDDLWSQLWLLVLPMAHVVAAIPLLNNLEGRKRSKTAGRLEVKLKQFNADFLGFIESAHVQEVLEPSSHMTSRSSHSTCCPPFPYAPHVLQYPPAGIFQMILYSVITYTHAILFPPLHVTLGSKQETKDFDITFYSIETCRTFAGIEDSYNDNFDVLFPCFSVMSLIAALTCPPNLRMWLRCKLAHFENLGQFPFEPLKKSLAVLWDMPEVLTRGFSPMSSNAPQDEAQISCGDVEITAIVENINLYEESDAGTSSPVSPGHCVKRDNALTDNDENNKNSTPLSGTMEYPV